FELRQIGHERTRRDWVSHFGTRASSLGSSGRGLRSVIFNASCRIDSWCNWRLLSCDQIFLTNPHSCSRNSVCGTYNSPGLKRSPRTARGGLLFPGWPALLVVVWPVTVFVTGVAGLPWIPFIQDRSEQPRSFFRQPLASGRGGLLRGPGRAHHQDYGIRQPSQDPRIRHLEHGGRVDDYHVELPPHSLQEIQRPWRMEKV